ncbi:MAG: type IV pilus assembly protein PilM [Candidatus Omnitrophica bacterium]|nr:type IV pilus assembly protein PilM [Candidatus Omnitrophota bacterium]
MVATEDIKARLLNVRDVCMVKAVQLWSLLCGQNKRDIAIGLSVGHSNIIAVEVERKNNEYKIVGVAAQKITPQANDKIELLKALFRNNKFTSSVINSSISGNAVITRYIRFPHMSKKDLRNALEFEAEKYIPFNLSDVFIDFDIICEEKEDTKKFYKLALVAVKKDAVLSFYDIIKAAGIQLNALDLDCFAYTNLFQVTYPEKTEEPVALVNIGAELTNISIIDNGHSAFTRDVIFGGTDITNKIAKLLNLSPEEALNFKYNLDVNVQENKIILKDSLKYFLQELKLSLDFFKNQVCKDKEVKSVYLFGGTSWLNGLCQIVNEELKVETFLFDPMKKFSVGENVDIQLLDQLRGSLSVPLGLAIRREE